MRMSQKFFRKGLQVFLKKEDGLVTVEWIALVAAVVVGGIAVVWTVMGQANSVATGISSSISAANSTGCATAGITTC